jgi:porin
VRRAAATRFALALALAAPFVSLAVALVPRAALAGDAGTLGDDDTLTGETVPAERRRLVDLGLRVRAELTGYSQRQLAGAGSGKPEQAGRFDALLDLDTGQAGLWRGGGLHLHLEHRFGELDGHLGGGFLPANVGLVLPLLSDGEWVATSLYLSQRFGSSTLLRIGKINPLDLIARDPFFGGWGVHGFMNMAFVAPPVGVSPAVIMGAIVSHAAGPFRFNLMVADPEDRTRQYGFGGLFDKGVDLATTALWTGAVAGRSTYAGLTGTWKHQASADAAGNGLPPDVRPPEGAGGWNVQLQAGHLLWESAALPGRGLGVYGRAGVGDGPSNPVRRLFAGGLAGHGVVPGRPRDAFGLGVYVYGFADGLASVIDPAMRLSNERGMEVFYSLPIARWLRLTVDLQVIRPADVSRPTAVVGGLRTSVLF